MLSRLLGSAPLRERRATLQDIKRLYARPPSFTSLLPWMEYDTARQVVWLEDGISCAAVFELTPVGCEARPPVFFERLREGLMQVLCDAIPEEEEPAPWVLQVYVQDELDLATLWQTLQSNIHARAQGSAFTEHYLGVLADHMKRFARPEGLFRERRGEPFRARRRRVRAVLYRRRPRGSGSLYRLAPAEELAEVAAKCVDSLAAAGVAARRAGAEDVYRWLLAWLNPRPAAAEGDSAALARLAPCPGDAEEAPFGADLAESLVLSRPRSDEATGTWWLDGMAHRVVTLQSLRKVPSIGLLTAERGADALALFDELSEGACLAITLTFRPQDALRAHLARIHHAAAGDGAEARIAREETEHGQIEIARGNKLFPLDLAVYLRAGSLQELRRDTHRVSAILVSQGLQPIADASDALALDSYLRYLPANFEPRLERSRRRSRLVFARDIAALLPLYGRSTGTGSPALLFWNRGGEPFCFDPLRDRKTNAHTLILGPTGAGKSALLCYCLMQMMAVYRPRVFIIEAGDSFRLLGEHFARLGLSVHQVTLKPQVDVSLPPYADALRLLDGRRRIDPTAGLDLDEEEGEDADDAGRDWLGEMEIATRIMVTGGEVREDNRMTRADRLLIREAILQAAVSVRTAGRAQVLTEDVVRALREVPTARRERAAEIADALALFTSAGSLEAHFFNRPGVAWPEADVTLFEMGILAQEGYEDKLTLAYVGLMNRIHALIERLQYQDRPTLVLTDEAHLITTNALLAPYVVKITKMWRKLGTWLWLATQNLEDFPAAAKRMLNMMEWWVCLSMPPEEVESIARFKELTDEERRLLLAARKEPGLYTEGVVLGKGLAALFRNVPPPLALALAMTEKHEKAERRRIMRERGCSELEAAYQVAERIARRGEVGR